MYPSEMSANISKVKSLNTKGIVNDLTEGTATGAMIGGVTGFMVGHFRHYNKMTSTLIGVLLGAIIARVYMVKK